MSVARHDHNSTISTGGAGERSAVELEQEAARIRGEMDQTLSQIEHRLSPNRLFDQIRLESWAIGASSPGIHGNAGGFTGLASACGARR
jgi:hypothetical protein